MLPYIRLFGLELPTYWLMSIIGITAVIIYFAINRKHWDLKTDDLIHILLMGIIGAILGAKLLYLITMLPVLVPNFKRIINDLFLLKTLITQGAVFYGGLLGALLSIKLYCRKYSVDFVSVSMIIAAGAPLFHFFGRLGCFCAGCCYGIEASWGVAFTVSIGAPNGVTLIPVQLFEAAANLLIFIFIVFFQRYSKHPDRSLSIYLVSYAACRFTLEFFRGDLVRGIYYGLSTSQWISLGVLIFFAMRSIIRRVKEAEEASYK